MGKILVAYATAAGSTGEVAEGIGKALRKGGATVEVCRAKEVSDVSGYSAVVLGTGVRAGQTYAEAASFLVKYQEDLRRMPVAGFVVCLTMKTDSEENCRQAEVYLDALFAKVPGIEPVSKGTFAGQVDYKTLPLPLRFILKVFIKEPGGDYRDWEAIDGWAAGLGPALMAA